MVTARPEGKGEKVCTDLQQQLSDGAHGAETQEAEREVASLKQQLEQAHVAQQVAVATLQQETPQAQLQSTSLIQEGLYY